jgi:hypothetical protein
LHTKDVLRAEKLHGWRFLRWDGLALWADPQRVWQRNGKLALRVLLVRADGAAEWADPLALTRRP